MAMQLIQQEDALASIDAPKMKKRFKIRELAESQNVAHMLTRQECDSIGRWVVNQYNVDMQSRKEWEQRNEQGMKLALQVVETKTFPWTNCSNVKFPLVTVAVLQFLARVSLLTKGRKLVKLEVVGADPDGKKAAQASRVSDHMNLQLVDEDCRWIDDDEKAKMSASIVGSAFKKTYYDEISGRTLSEFIPAQDFVFDYWSKGVEGCGRFTHLLHKDLNWVRERERQGLFCEMDDVRPGAPATVNLLQRAADEQQGVREQTQGEAFDILEQHAWLDLDKDGYAEPYIFFVRYDTGQCLRIVARFLDHNDVHRLNDSSIRLLDRKLKANEGEDESKKLDLKEQSRIEKKVVELMNDAKNPVIRIDPRQYFTQYTFIPSPDGGGYGLGLGALLGPINEATNSLLNQLVDAGTMSNTAGGFMARGVKMKGGRTAFDPFEWKPVDSTGDDLRKNIFPLPVREPSAVLFQLLGVLIQYGEKISGATDIMTGVSPGQNTPAETSRNTVEQGMMLFSGIYARMWRSFREELKKFHGINRLFLESSPHWDDLTSGPNAILAPTDYVDNAFRIFPAADPAAASPSQRKEKADRLLQWAFSPMGAVADKHEANCRWLEAHDYENPEALLPDPNGQKAIKPPMDPKMQVEQMRMQAEQQQHQDDMMLKTAELKSTIALNEAKIAELQAKAFMEVQKGQGEEAGHQIALLNAQIAAAKQSNEEVRVALQEVAQRRRDIMDHSHHLDNMSMQHDQLQQKKKEMQQKSAATAGE